MLSLGPLHSFPLSDVFRYLHPETTRDVLVQAFLDAPVFETRWRWNTTVSLAVPRRRGARKLAPQIQRMLAEDLLASVFPDAAACLENIPGDREIPDHPLVKQTVRDCLEEAMDFEGLRDVLTRIHRGELRLVARDTPEPSVFAYEILDARPYAFLDDAPLEERRSHAVQTRRGGQAADELGALDLAAIARVRDEERPDPRDADELHDALMTAGFLTRTRSARTQICSPRSSPRGARPWPASASVAAERSSEIMAVHPTRFRSAGAATAVARARDGRATTAIVELLRGRLDDPRARHRGALAASLGIETVKPTPRCSRSRAKASSCVGISPQTSGLRPRDLHAPGMVRSRAARAHSSLHGEPPARGDRAGQPGGLHALPVQVAARRSQPIG